jgi:hypothetical protein
MTQRAFIRKNLHENCGVGVFSSRGLNKAIAPQSIIKIREDL